MPDWSGGKYFSPGMEGSRSDGLLAATWASLVSLGREGYRGYAKDIFETSATMQAAVRSHPELRLLGDPTFLFAFTSDEFDIYHVNDEMKRRGWRFNGLQYPERPAHGCHPAADPAGRHREVRAGPRRRRWSTRMSTRIEPAESAAIYGGVPGRADVEAEQFIRTVMAQLMDAQQSVPAPA